MQPSLVDWTPLARLALTGVVIAAAIGALILPANGKSVLILVVLAYAKAAAISR